MKILGYYVANDGEKDQAKDVFVAIDERWSHLSDMTVYAPIGQHGGGDKRYLDICTKITKEEYLKASGHLYTPVEYLK